jgi:hypothetical protein
MTKGEGHVPRRGGNSYFRYPCLKNFFFKSPITNDLEATKAYTTPLMRPWTKSSALDLAIRRSAASESDH